MRFYLKTLLILVFCISSYANSNTPIPETDIEARELHVQFGVDRENDLNPYQIDRILPIVLELFTQPSKVKIISNIFRDLMILSPYSLRKVASGELEAPIAFKVLTKEEEKLKEQGKFVMGLTRREFREKKVMSELFEL